jgi:serine/threonine protein kinase
MILVMEYISGIDLFDRIIESKRLDEDTARKLYRQLFSAIMYCHDNMIVHRDLKPENLLLDENNNLKIIDFGFVRTYSKDPFSTLKTFCGSMYYCAPEMINGTPYPGPASDIWSLGVILYVITNGYLPFRENNLEDLYESLKVAKYDKGEYSSQGKSLNSTVRMQ